MPLKHAVTTDQDAILTSENGKRWLDAKASFPEQIATSALPQVSVAIEPEAFSARDISIGTQIHTVSIPDVANECKANHPATGVVDRKLIADSFAKKSERQLQTIALQRTDKDKTNEAPLDAQPDASNQRSGSEIDDVSEVATPASKQATIRSRDETDRQVDELDGIVDSILRRTTKGKSSLILFVGTSDNKNVDKITADTSQLLSKRRCGSVLLVDANGSDQGLSRATGTHRQPGWIDALLGDDQSMIRQGAASGVDFLGYGSKRLSHAKFESEARSIASQWIQHYDYICISAGSSQSVDAQLWSDICDGCYLLVSQQDDHPTLARTAVAELRTSGAKLLGCVVTETEG